MPARYRLPHGLRELLVRRADDLDFRNTAICLDHESHYGRSVQFPFPQKDRHAKVCPTHGLDFRRRKFSGVDVVA